MSCLEVFLTLTDVPFRLVIIAVNYIYCTYRQRKLHIRRNANGVIKLIAIVKVIPMNLLYATFITES